MSFHFYKYYDTPDGEDVWKKLYCTNKLAVLSSLMIGVYDVTHYSHPKGYIPTIMRMGFFTVPFVGMASAFTTTTYLATNFRKKDDTLNYFLGGAVAGQIFGVWVKNPWIGAFASVAFGLAATVKKHSIMYGWEFFPEVSMVEHSTATSHRDLDFSLAPDTQGNWIRG